MGLLSTILVDRDFARQAFAVLKQSLHVLPKPASIIEIGLDEDDYEQLKSWLAQKHWDSHVENALITGYKAIDSRSGYTDSEIIGLLLHALYAEHSRRVGAEWLYWPVIRKLEWHYSVEHWFSGNNPTLAHRNILAAAAEKFNLRNSFDDGGAEWFMTGKLQFGFTMRGAEAKLQEWLANPYTRTHAINALLGTDGLGLDSKSFKELFAALLSYRQNNLSLDRTRTLLESSPWVLPKSINGILEAAKRSASDGSADSEYSLQPEFLSVPVLRITDQEVSFYIEISGLSSIGLEETDHEISDANGVCVASLRYNGDTGFQSLPAGISVPWEKSQGELIYTLRPSGSPAVVANQSVSCWEPADWVQIFSTDGRWLRNEKTIPQQILQTGFDLICPTNCELKGVFTSRQNIDSNWVLYRGVQATGGQDVLVMHDGDIIWDSQSAKSQDNNLRQAQLQVEVSPLVGLAGQFDGQCKLRVSIHPLFELKHVQIGSHKLNPANAGKAGGESFHVNHDEWCTSLPVIVRAKMTLNGQTGIIRTRVNLRPPTFIWMNESLAIGNPYKILLTGSDSVPRLGVGPVVVDSMTTADGHLFEGNRHRAKCPHGAFTPANLSGLGEKLDVWPGVFNEPQDTWTLAKNCVDQGIIKRCIYVVGTDGTLEAQIKVSKSSAQSEAIGWIACLTGPKTFKIQIKSRNQNDLVLSLPSEATKENLLGIFAVYEERRVGSWFNRKDAHSPYLIIDVARAEVALSEHAISYAKIIRAGKLPILDENTAHHLRAWINQSPIQIFLSLLKPVTAKNSTDFCEAGETAVMKDWNRAVGMIYEKNSNKGCKVLTVEDAMEVLRFFNSEQPIGPLLTMNGVLSMVELTRQMAFVSPVLARDVVRLLSTELETSLTPAAWLTQIKQSLHCSQRDIDNLGKPLRMHIDSNFFATTLSAGANAQQIPLRNLSILLQLPTPSDRSRHAARDQRTAYLLSQ